jgi:ParB family transcriptional regulator, chromosome partitioning protein
MEATQVKERQDVNTTREISQVISVQVERIRPFADQPRHFFDQAKLRELAESIKASGQIYPGAVKRITDDPEHDYELIDGQRRWHAIEMAGLSYMKVILIDPKDVLDQFIFSIIANFNREPHQPLEIAKAVKYIYDQKKPVIEIAKIFGKSTIWVYQQLKIMKLDLRVLDLMSSDNENDECLNFSTALLLADVPQTHQLTFAMEIVSRKFSTSQAKHFIRRIGQELNVTIGSHNRSPKADYNVFSHLLQKTSEELEIMIEKDQKFFDKMFEFRELREEEMEKKFKQIAAIFNNMVVVLGALKKTKANWKPPQNSS